MTEPALDVTDRIALSDLVAKYAHAVDRRDLRGVVECFTDNGRLEFVSTGVSLDGRDAISAFFATVFGGSIVGSDAASTHLMGNTMLVSHDDPTDSDAMPVAHLATSGLVAHADRSTARVVVRGLTYTDRCARIDGRWYFDHRVHRLHWQGQLPGEPAASDPLFAR